LTIAAIVFQVSIKTFDPAANWSWLCSYAGWLFLRNVAPLTSALAALLALVTWRRRSTISLIIALTLAVGLFAVTMKLRTLPQLEPIIPIR